MSFTVFVCTTRTKTYTVVHTFAHFSFVLPPRYLETIDIAAKLKSPPEFSYFAVEQSRERQQRAWTNQLAVLTLGRPEASRFISVLTFSESSYLSSNLPCQPAVTLAFLFYFIISTALFPRFSSFSFLFSRITFYSTSPRFSILQMEHPIQIPANGSTHFIVRTIHCFIQN